MGSVVLQLLLKATQIIQYRHFWIAQQQSNLQLLQRKSQLVITNDLCVKSFSSAISQGIKYEATKNIQEKTQT